MNLFTLLGFLGGALIGVATTYHLLSKRLKQYDNWVSYWRAAALAASRELDRQRARNAPPSAKPPRYLPHGTLPYRPAESEDDLNRQEDEENKRQKDREDDAIRDEALRSSWIEVKNPHKGEGEGW